MEVDTVFIGPKGTIFRQADAIGHICGVVVCWLTTVHLATPLLLTPLFCHSRSISAEDGIFIPTDSISKSETR